MIYLKSLPLPSLFPFILRLLHIFSTDGHVCSGLGSTGRSTLPLAGAASAALIGAAVTLSKTSGINEALPVCIQIIVYPQSFYDKNLDLIIASCQ